MVSDSAKEVLLISRRRQNYDRVHAVLTDIGALRAQLGLNHGDNWRSPESDDFTRNSVGVCSEYDSLLAKIDQVKEREKARSSKESKKSRLLATFWFAAVPLGLVGLFWLSNSMSVQSVSPLPVNTQGVHTSDGTTDRPSSTVPTESAFNAPELPLPANGTIRWHISMIGVAPLEIRTSSGSNYLVKLERVRTVKMFWISSFGVSQTSLSTCRLESTNWNAQLGKSGMAMSRNLGQKLAIIGLIRHSTSTRTATA